MEIKWQLLVYGGKGNQNDVDATDILLWSLLYTVKRLWLLGYILSHLVHLIEKMKGKLFKNGPS